jgi:hypothetical protein
MSVSAINGSLTSLNSSATKSKADETIQQLADEGDPIAIAELKQQQEEQNPTPQTGATEPGKGEQIDKYV